MLKLSVLPKNKMKACQPGFELFGLSLHISLILGEHQAYQIQTEQIKVYKGIGNLAWSQLLSELY